MKQALIDGRLVAAGPDVSATATCPSCGRDVELRNRQGTYFWRHLKLPRGGCDPQEFLTLAKSEAAASTDGAGRRMRQVGDFIIEFVPSELDAVADGIRLRRLDAAEIIISQDQVQPLAEALLEVAADWLDVDGG